MKEYRIQTYVPKKYIKLVKEERNKNKFFWSKFIKSALEDRFKG